MRWGTTIGVALLTSIAGAAASCWLTYECVIWYRLRTPDLGELGYYLIFVPAGALCGLVLGTLVSRFVPGFWPSIGIALATLAGVSSAVALVARTYGEVPPELDGDRLMLQVELRCPRGWQPAGATQRPEGRSCRLQPVGPDLRARTPMYGTVDWKKASQSDDQWVIPCDVNLISSREMRLVSFRLGEEWIEFNLPLSPNPTSADKAWSEWRADGFTREAGKPPVEGYTYRVRVKGIQEIRDEQADAGRAFWQEREDAARAIPADAPIERWLPLFEDPDGSPADYRWGGADRIERHAIAARVLELAPLLESKDRTVVRQAVFALASLRETPKDLVPPLLTAGRITLDLIHEAQTPRETPDLTGADPGRKALQYFDMWSRAMRNAGASDGEFRKVLADVRRDAEGKGGDLSILANKAKDIEDALPPSGK